ncbi:citrate:proton symporter [Streptococcus penaeicida]|uniref:Citrate:proton symporter n=2 Tax=Streptococcus TaxID=1301 RepID=A0A2N8LEB3_9STRE|nr:MULTISPECIES: citrate:proton symporter [Streptococcus]OJF71678.1 citrate:proton symporter [Streptococcus bovimastitidis]PND48508.1 citrate:proton symporter [Streptococcus penaeicida]
MLAILGYLMIVTFMVLLLTKKMTPFNGLVLVPVVFGLIAALVTKTPILDAFQWIFEGLYFKPGDAGKITAGVAPTITLLLFAILYFSVMLDAGLFDPLAVYMIKWAKGDPMKITIASALITLAVSLDGDGTTTVLIVTSAMLLMYKKMGMKQIYLAAIIGFGNSVMNLVPWSGPMARAMPVLNIGPKEFLLPVLPGMFAAGLLCIFQAYTYGKKERKRLGYKPGMGILTDDETEHIISDVTLNNIQYKRPKLIWFNLALTIAIMVLLIMDVINGGILFLLGTGIALMVNYKDLDLQNSRLLANGAEALGPVSLVFGAGVIMGILNGSGMSSAIATQLVSMIPENLGSYIPFILALISLPGLFFLPNDAFYFGILPVIAPIAYSYGATPVEIGVASLMGQAVRFASPLVAFLYVLVDRTEVSFVDYQKEYLKWGLISFVLQTAIAILTGAIPL